MKTLFVNWLPAIRFFLIRRGRPAGIHRCTNRLRSLIAVVGLLFASIAASQSETIFASNYDAKLTVGDSVNSAQSRVKVRSGHTIPIGFQRHRIEIRVSEKSADEYQASLSIYENIEGSWQPINTERLTFSGAYSAPAVYEWRVGDVALDLAIVVSVFTPEQDQPLNDQASDNMDQP